MVDGFFDKLKPRKKRCKKCKESTVHEYAWWYIEGSICQFYSYEKKRCGCGNKDAKEPCIGPLRMAPFCLQCGNNDLPNNYKIHGVIDVQDI